MKNIQLNPLKLNQRRLLQFGVALILIAFLTIFFVVSRKSQNIGVKNNTVYLQDGKLYLFDEIIPVNQYPDRLVFHYPYLVVVKPEQQKSLVYNLDTKLKEIEAKQVLLDYFDGKSLSNSGSVTYFDGQDLGVLCEKGFVKNSYEVLCITKINKDNVENKLISIDIKTKKQKAVYASKNLLTDVSVINGVLYIGEIDLYSQTNYVIVDGKCILSPDVVSLIYEINKKARFASYKSAFNGQKEASYSIEADKIVKQEVGKIQFYRPIN